MPFFEEPEIKEDGLKQLSEPSAQEVLKYVIKSLEKNPLEGTSQEQPKEIINNCSKELGIKKGLIMKSLRAALLGTTKGPDLISTWLLLTRVGKDRNRLSRAITS